MGCLFGKPKVLKRNDDFQKGFVISNPFQVNRSAYDMNPVIKSPVIFVSGVPGAGCNTVSQTLSAITGYHVINPGELVRKEAANITTLRGMRLSKMLVDNKVSEEVIVDLVKENMLENVGAKGFILCGFPKNKRMAIIYKRQVKTPEKVVSLQVADEVAIMRLQQKLTELGRSETEVLEAEEVVRSAAPKIKKVTERFKKNSSVIMVNSSQGNIDTLKETLHAASESFKELMESEITDAPKKDGEGFDVINLSSSLESCPLITLNPLASRELIGSVDVPVEPRQMDSTLEALEPLKLGALVQGKIIRNTDSVTSCTSRKSGEIFTTKHHK